MPGPLTVGPSRAWYVRLLISVMYLIAYRTVQHPDRGAEASVLGRRHRVPSDTPSRLRLSD